MYKITEKRELAPGIKLIKVFAPEIAKKAKAGQFVILRVDAAGERIPLTLADWDPKEGLITIVFLEVGVSTKKLGKLNVGDVILNLLGPLGNPTEVKNYGTVCVVGGGVGIAAAYPIARALKGAGNKIVSIIGARSANLLIFEEEMRKCSDEIYVSTDDGTKGYKGFVSDVLKDLLLRGYKFDMVYAVGPALMMKAVADVTRPYEIKTIVSLNPIMVDGMGMCGACRVIVGGKMMFTCVDGPEFDAHEVDFVELIRRQRAFIEEERLALEIFEKSGGKVG